VVRRTYSTVHCSTETRKILSVVKIELIRCTDFHVLTFRRGCVLPVGYGVIEISVLLACTSDDLARPLIHEMCVLIGRLIDSPPAHALMAPSHFSLRVASSS